MQKFEVLVEDNAEVPSALSGLDVALCQLQRGFLLWVASVSEID